MARINVSVPDDLKERMSALDDRVNWSEVAQAAFEREVSNRTFKGEDMEDVIERLRVSKAEFKLTEHEKGKRDGIEWAKRFANYKDLEQIGGFFWPEDDEGDFSVQFDRAVGLNPERGESFWLDEETSRVKRPSNDYVEGYVEGAEEVWKAVEEKL